jgi:hypothetical protein
MRESNLILEEKRLLSEDDVTDNEYIESLMDMDAELDDDPVYKRYEEKLARNKIRNMIKQQMGDEEEIPDEMIDMFMMMSKSGVEKNKTPEKYLKHRDGIIEIVDEIIDMATEDDELELAQKLKDYKDKLENL